jgi:hypothetical protein
MKSRVKPQTLEEHILSQEQLLNLPDLELYFADFINKKTGKSDFRKFGVTGKKTALERFYNKYEKDQYEDWDINIICSVRLKPEIALEREFNLQKRFPKNLIIEKKIKGVTEIFTGYDEYIPLIIEYFETLKQKFGT